MYGFILPSKFLFPLSTAKVFTLFSRISFCTSGIKGPAFPIHVVHPYPTSSNPILFRYSISPAFLRYSVTTLDPGARLVFMVCAGTRWCWTAFFASNPAPRRTKGSDVLVQLVMAESTTAPFLTSLPLFPPLIISSIFSFTSSMFTSSSGFFGPATALFIAERSISTVSLYFFGPL